MEIYVVTACTQPLREILLSQIECIKSRTNPEIDMEELLHSLSQVGQLSPVRVRKHPTKPDMYETIFGSRRVLAAKKLGWKTIVCDVVEVNDSDALVLTLLENLDRKDFTDYEKALLFEKLHVVSGKTYVEIAHIIGRSPAMVSQHIAMLHLFPRSIGSEEERVKVLSQISEKHARILAKVDNVSERWNTAKLCVNAKLGPRELERLCRRPAPKPRSERSESAIRRIIENVINGFNSRDIRPFVKSISRDKFTLFAGFPPFYKMDCNIATEHVYDVMRGLDKYTAVIEKLEISVQGKFAYATMKVAHDLSAQGKSMNVTQRATIIFQLESQWEIIHWHWSALTPPDFSELFKENRPSQDTKNLPEDPQSVGY